MKKVLFFLAFLFLSFSFVKGQTNQSEINSAPNVPSNLTAYGFSSNEIHLKWNNVATETGYYIYKRIGIPFMLIDSTLANDTVYVDHDLMPLEQACYAVAAFNQDGVSVLSNEACSSTLASIDESILFKEISISPNPFTQSTQITLPQTYRSITLEVYNLQGQQVAQYQYADCDKIQLMRNHLGSGLYFLKLTGDDGEVRTGKVVIEE